MKLQPKTIQAISQKVYRRFPEIAGINPKVQTRPVPKTLTSAYEPTFLMIYEKKVQTSQGNIIDRTVRVVVNQAGEILRISTSR